MPASFIDGPAEMRALLEVFKNEVLAGTVTPILSGEEAEPLLINLGLDEHSIFFIRLEKNPRTGTIEVQLRRSDDGLVEAWASWEIGRVVEELWTACRNRLYSSGFEDGVARLTEWLRRHRTG